MDASYKIQRGIHVHLIQFFMCPEFWVHIMSGHELLRWLEAETIGSYSLSRLPSGVEVACDLRVDQSGEKYRRYHEEICKLAVGKLLRME